MESVCTEVCIQSIKEKGVVNNSVFKVFIL